jgi:metal-responsive CopG/Arc/MetJ family transcriptional regulator
MLRARQYVSIYNSNLRLTLQGQPILTDSFDSIITKAKYGHRSKLLQHATQ